MGKAALFITFGAALFVAQGLLSQTETERQTAQNQAGFEEGVVAREIARSGFNVAMGILREHGNNIHEAIRAINKDGTGRKYLEGSHQGGTFRARAELVNGEIVRITSVGYIGGSFVRLNGSEEPEAGWCSEPDPFSSSGHDYYTGACHTMSDVTGDSPIYEYELPSGDPLTAKLECGKLDVRFIESTASYCSAVYLERTLPLNITEGDDPNAGTPEPAELLFVPGNNRDGQTLAGVSKYIRGGTQMNFFIGVDENCSSRPTSTSVEGFPAFTGNASNPAPYDHLHYALAEEVGKFGDMSETPWAFTEMHPDGIVEDDVSGAITQRWRIGWEDQHVASWDNPSSDDPANSLQALKRFGYDGLGWPTADGEGYRALRDFGSRPDFSDQVVEVKLIEETNVSLCAPPEEEEEPTVEPPEEEEPPVIEPPVIEPPVIEPEPEEECMCPQGNNDKKVAIWHQEGKSKGKVICIGRPAVAAHLTLHNDHEKCEGE